MKRPSKALQKEWYKKLHDNGFRDIESDENHLKFYTSQFGAKFLKAEGVWEAKARYYQMAENFLGDYKFASEMERVIWEYHSNGISYRNIAKLIAKLRLVKKTNRTTIYQVIKRLKIKMYDMYVAENQEYHE